MPKAPALLLLLPLLSPPSLAGETTREVTAGDASLYGSVEVRSWFGRLMTPVLPMRLGAFAFAETGRVWFADEESTNWHGSYGGGALLQPLGAPITIHATVAAGDEGTRFSFGSGYSF